MDLVGIIESIEASGLAEWLRTSLKAIPIIEAVHVMAVGLVFGTILIVDLRLLGFPGTRRAFTRISGEMLGYTWIGFVVAVITGALMFVANAMTYYDNVLFRWKLVMLLAAGVNMAVFHFGVERKVAAWDVGSPVPRAGRIAGALSIVIWIAVIFLGRWVGFTGYEFEAPEAVELDLDFLQ